MSAATSTRVRVRAERAISLRVGDGDGAHTVLHVAGAELELDPDEAERLVEQGFVELDGPPRVRSKGSERERPGGDVDLE
jgi:hypothetical protein